MDSLLATERAEKKQAWEEGEGHPCIVLEGDRALASNRRLAIVPIRDGASIAVPGGRTPWPQPSRRSNTPSALHGASKNAIRGSF